MFRNEGPSLLVGLLLFGGCQGETAEPRTGRRLVAVTDPAAPDRQAVGAPILAAIEAVYAADLTARLPTIPTHMLPDGFVTDPDRGRLGYRLSHHGIPEMIGSLFLRIPVTGPCSGETCARAFLSERAALFGIIDATSEFEFLRTTSLPSGDTVVRYVQRHAGVRVHDGMLTITVDAGGRITWFHGHYVPDIAVPATPVLSAIDARAVAQGIGDQPYAEPFLVYVESSALGGASPGAVLAWSVPIEFQGLDGQRFIDAGDGTPLGLLWDGHGALNRHEIYECADSCSSECQGPYSSGCTTNVCNASCDTACGIPCPAGTFRNTWGGCEQDVGDGIYSCDAGRMALDQQSLDNPPCECGGGPQGCLPGQQGFGPCGSNTCQPEAISICDDSGDADNWYRDGISDALGNPRDGWRGNGDYLRIVNNTSFFGSGANADWRRCYNDDDGDKCSCGAIYLGRNYATQDVIAHETNHGVWYCENSVGGIARCGTPEACAISEHTADAQAVWTDTYLDPTGFDWNFNLESGTARWLANPPSNKGKPLIDPDTWFNMGAAVQDNPPTFNVVSHDNAGIGNKAAYLAGACQTTGACTYPDDPSCAWNCQASTFDEVTVSPKNPHHVGHSWFYGMVRMGQNPLWVDWRDSMILGALDETARGGVHNVPGLVETIEDAADAVGVWGSAPVQYTQTTTTDQRPHVSSLVVGGTERMYIIWRSNSSTDPGQLRWRIYDGVAWLDEANAHASTLARSDRAPYMFRTCQGCQVAGSDGCCGRVIWKASTGTTIRYFDVNTDSGAVSPGVYVVGGTGGPFTEEAPAGAYFDGSTVYAYRSTSDGRVYLYKADSNQTVGPALCAQAQASCGLLGAGPLVPGGAPSATVHTDGNLWIAGACASDFRVHVRAWSPMNCETGEPFRPLGGADPVLDACDANGSQLPGGGTDCPTASGTCSPSSCTSPPTCTNCVVDLNCNFDPIVSGQPIIASSNDPSAPWLYVSLQEAGQEFYQFLYIQRFVPGSGGTVSCSSTPSPVDGSMRSRIQWMEWPWIGLNASAPTVAKWDNYLYYVYTDGGQVKRMRRELE